MPFKAGKIFHTLVQVVLNLYVLFLRYTFQVMATDGALYDNRTERATVTVNILDVNDNAPVFKEIPYIATVTGEARRPVIQVAVWEVAW